MKLFYLGPLGSYSNEAAEIWKKKSGQPLQIVAKNSFQDIFAQLETDADNLAIVPIENSITSNVHENIDQIFSQNVTIVGELFLHIKLHLFTLKEAQIKDIKTVFSHPKALQQVSKITALHSWEVFPTSSTSKAGKLVQEKQDKKLAVIGPRNLSQFYPGLILQQEDVGDQKNNFTRFLIVSAQKENRYSQKDSKATYIFTVPHRPGGLLEVLIPLNEATVNITKIESRPIPEEPWCYSFWIDVETAGVEELKKVEKIMQQSALSSKLLGSYEKSSVFES